MGRSFSGVYFVAGPKMIPLDEYVLASRELGTSLAESQKPSWGVPGSLSRPPLASLLFNFFNFGLSRFRSVSLAFTS